MKDSAISWTDHTFNPWIGCTKVSPGCANCYAATQDKFRKWTPEGWGAGKPRKRTSASNWNEPRRWDATTEMMRRAIGSGSTPYIGEPYRRPRVFCASLADWLDDEVPIEWLADLLALIHETPHLDWLLLTKRPENWAKRIEAAQDWDFDHARKICGWASDWRKHGIAPANAWIGTTVEDQQRADERIPELVNIPARVRFLSCEPLLGPVDLWGTGATSPQLGINWVICGGESGPGARPMQSDWARSLRSQCAEAGAAFHFKQWGEWLPQFQQMHEERKVNVLQTHYWTNGASAHRVGKKAAGRLLDGVEHNALPEITP